MKYLAHALATVLFMAASAASSHAEIVTLDDSSKINSSFNKLALFNRDTVQIGQSLARAARMSDGDSLRVLFCFMQVQQQIDFVLFHLNAVVYVVGLAPVMHDPIDERFTLDTAKLTLIQLSKALDDGRGEVNRIFGDSCGRRQIVYDNAKILLDHVTQINKIIVPLLKRIESAKF